MEDIVDKWYRSGLSRVNAEHEMEDIGASG